jgi:hypothetical protein
MVWNASEAFWSRYSVYSCISLIGIWKHLGKGCGLVTIYILHMQSSLH